MIRRLRARHRRFWIVLAVLVPLLVALALLVRPDPPSPDALPEAISMTTAPAAGAEEDGQ